MSEMFFIYRSILFPVNPKFYNYGKMEGTRLSWRYCILKNPKRWVMRHHAEVWQDEHKMWGCEGVREERWRDILCVNVSQSDSQLVREWVREGVLIRMQSIWKTGSFESFVGKGKEINFARLGKRTAPNNNLSQMITTTTTTTTVTATTKSLE